MILTPLPPKGTGRTTRIKELLQLLAVAGGLATAIWGVSSAWVGSFAMDAEVESSLTAHNLSETAHPRDALKAETLERSIAELQASRAQTAELWRVLVGYGCSDRETDHRLKAAAAAYCRDTFSEKVAKGATPVDAYRETSREPWFTRPKVR